jgi:CheY-like chemotaxis protein
MPEMDGLEATHRIRQEMDEQPRIIAMTASAMQEDRDACQAAGMDDYVSKPIRVEELVSALSKCESQGSANQPENGTRGHKDVETVEADRSDQ